MAATKASKGKEKANEELEEVTKVKKGVALNSKERIVHEACVELSKTDKVALPLIARSGTEMSC